MQFRDLKKQYQVLKWDIDAAMVDVAASSAFIMGKPVKELENELAEYVGVKYCISCGISRTDVPYFQGEGERVRTVAARSVRAVWQKWNMLRLLRNLRFGRLLRMKCV